MYWDGIRSSAVGVILLLADCFGCLVVGVDDREQKAIRGGPTNFDAMFHYLHFPIRLYEQIHLKQECNSKPIYNCL